MSRKVQPNKSWNGDDQDGFSRRQSNAHKLSSISYPGLDYYMTHPSTSATSPPAAPSSTSSTRATPGPCRAAYPNPSASMPPRAVSAPAAFTPQVGGYQPLPVSTQPPKATLPTHIAFAVPQHHTQAPQHQAQAPQGIATSPLRPEMHKSGKWCWVTLSGGWTWAWVPNVLPHMLASVPATAHRWSRRPPMVSWGTSGPIIVTAPPETDWCQCIVKALAENDRWYWVQALVPSIPPGPPPPPLTAEHWAAQGPPPS